MADTINGCVDKSGGLRVVLVGEPCKNSESGPMIPYQVKRGVEVTTASGGGGGTGKAVFSPFEVLKVIDSNSADLFKDCVTGTHLTKVTITINATTTSPAEVFELQDVLISSDNLSPSCETLLEDLKFDFARIQITVAH